MYVLSDPNEVFKEQFYINGTAYPCLTAKIIYDDPDYIVENNFTKVNITTNFMTQRELSIQFDFP